MLRARDRTLIQRLRVVSWNVGRIYLPNGNNRLDDDDIPHVARTLAEVAPDIVLLQELVGRAQLEALLARLPGYLGDLATACVYDRHVAVLARAALTPTFEQHTLGETGRGLVAARLAVGSHDLAAYAVHLDAFDARRRRSQAESLMQLSDARTESVVLVGGDFNLDPAWARGTHNLVDSGTFRLFEERFVTAPHTGPSLFGFLRVDHLFGRGALNRFEVRVVQGRRLALGDHDLLLGDIEVAGEVDADKATS